MKHLFLEVGLKILSKKLQPQTKLIVLNAEEGKKKTNYIIRFLLKHLRYSKDPNLILYIQFWITVIACFSQGVFIYLVKVNPV